MPDRMAENKLGPKKASLTEIRKKKNDRL
uniref:Uncharacterized protein n=1 Tax=Anguilla anguilla TaxID=7936 RepID=A0A0E9UFT1_ANGAN